ERDDVDGNLRRARLAAALRLEQGGREWRGIDRHAKLRPEVEQRPEMILMRVREHDADEVAALLDQEPDVGKDEIDPGQQVLASERHAEVDGEPGPAALGARAVDREIHPDLADAAGRREPKLARSGHQPA